jgi:NADH-ubiquinone oxidoreductase chain 5
MREVVPFVYICFVIGSFAIMGFPFLTGYYSKDLILEFTYSRYIINASFIYFLGVTSAICTAIYSFRVLYFIFASNKPGVNLKAHQKLFSMSIVECPWAMLLSMLLLAIASIIMGFISSDLINGVGIMY